MGPGFERGAGLVEADVPIRADAENDEVEPAGLRQRALVALALPLRIARVPRRNSMFPGARLTCSNNSRSMYAR